MVDGVALIILLSSDAKAAETWSLIILLSSDAKAAETWWSGLNSKRAVVS